MPPRGTRSRRRFPRVPSFGLPVRVHCTALLRIERYTEVFNICPVLPCANVYFRYFTVFPVYPSLIGRYPLLPCCSSPEEESPWLSQHGLFTRACKTSSPSRPPLPNRAFATRRGFAWLVADNSRVEFFVASRSSRDSSGPADLSGPAIPSPPLTSAISRFHPSPRSSLIPVYLPPAPLRALTNFLCNRTRARARAVKGRLIKAAKSRARMQTRSILILL
jgi:hypothetical protein